jgi:hypothetical protein
VTRAAHLTAPQATLWIAAEHLPQFQALWPGARLDPPIAAPAEYAEREWSTEEALREVIRGRLEGLGPATAEALAAALGWEPKDITAALASLEAEGFALRGRFTPNAAAEEWCERRLLARIHRYTVGRLRAEIQPVSSRDFLRFLFSWQRVSPDARMGGADALDILVRSSKVSRQRPVPGRPRSCRHGSRITSRPGSTTNAFRDGSSGRDSGPATRGQMVASAIQHRCGRRRSRFWRGVTLHSGQRFP